MKIVNISVNSTDPKMIIPPARELEDEFGLEIELFCWDSSELDDDLLKYQELVRVTKDADLILIRCMADPTRFNRFDKYENLLKEAKGLVLVYSGNADVKFVYRNLFSGSDEEFIELGKYVGYRGVENERGLLLWLNRRLGGPAIEVPEPMKQRTNGIYHPDYDRDISLEEYLTTLDSSKPTVGIMFTGSLWLFDNLLHIDALIKTAESKGMNTIPVFFSTSVSNVPGEKGTARLVEHYFMENGKSRIDVMIMSTPFSQLVNSRETQGMNTPDDENFYRYLTNVPVLQAMTVNGVYTDYEENALGLNKNEIYAQVSWPEVDGQIITVPIGESKERSKGLRRTTPIDDRIEHITELAKNWAILKRTPPKDRKIAILLYQSRPDSGRIGSAAGLDTLESVSDILQKMDKIGYTVENVPANGKELITELLNGVTNNLEWMSSETIKENAIDMIDKQRYLREFGAVPEFNQNDITKKWGEPIGEITVDSGKMVIPGVLKGNVLVGYQPLRAWFEQADGVCHDPILPMPHQYLEYYRWLQHDFGVQMVIHVGTHGTLEWLPGKNVGLSNKCYPDLVLNSIPHMYPYVIDDPGEGIQTKRRSEAVVIGHMCPTMAKAGGYDDLAPVEVPLQEYFKFRNSAPEERQRTLIEEIYEASKTANLFDDLGIPQDADVNLFEEHLPDLHDYITEVKEAIIRDGLHIMGRAPEGDRLEENIYSLMRLRNGDVPSMRTALSEVMGIDIESALDKPTEYSETGELNSMAIERADEAYQLFIKKIIESDFNVKACTEYVNQTYGAVSEELTISLEYTCNRLVPNLMKMTDEVDNLLAGFNGEYVLPGPSGAPTRGGADILPMGRNYYGVDPSMVPSKAAWTTGVKMAEQMMSKYIEEKGHYPREVGFIIWATDTMKTSGDDMAYILWLMGVRPVWSKVSGHIIDLEAVPLSELGRPRLDVTVRITGLFRDTFPNLIDMIDDAVMLISELDEGEEENYLAANLRREIIDSVEKGLPMDEARRRSSVRVFGSPPGAYGPGVTHAIESGDWKTVQDLADIYVSWGSYGYGRDLYGESMKEEFIQRFGKVGVTIKNMPDREIDLLDIDDVYGYLGGLNAFIKTYGNSDALSFMGDGSDPDRVKLRDTKEEMRFVFRSKILNPKFLDGLKEHGYRGVTEIAKMTEYMLGWDATSDAIDDWMYEGVAEKFLFDEDTLKWMEEENPYAVMDILNRLHEIIERGLWDPKETTIEKLQELYIDIEGKLEMLTDR